MTSIKRAGRITTFGFAVGAGLAIAAGAGAATAAAAPGDNGHTANSASASRATASSAHTARTSTGASAKPKARKPSVKLGSTTPVVTLSASKRTPAPAASELTAPTAPTGYAKQSRAQRLPTPAEVQQAIVAGLDGARRTLDTIRQDFEALVKHQIEGIQENLTTLRYDLEAIFSPSRPPVNPDIPPDDTPGIIGNPDAKLPFFVFQGDAQTCVLMATTMVIGQLTGVMPDPQQIIYEALTTPSTVKPGPMFNPKTGTNSADVLALLEKHGIAAVSTQYSKGQADLAWDNLKQTLIDGNSVIAIVKAQILWGRGTPDMAFTGDHDVTVLGIDTVNNIVYLNDSAWESDKGQGMAVPMDLFMKAWSANEYWSISAQLIPPTDTTNTVSA